MALVQRTDAITRLRGVLPEIRARFGVRDVILFGSTARDEARPNSDVDLVVDLGPTPSYDTLFDVHARLEAALGCKVDALTPGALRPRLRAIVEREGIHVA